MYNALVMLLLILIAMVCISIHRKVRFMTDELDVIETDVTEVLANIQLETQEVDTAIGDLQELKSTGISPNDPRLADIITKLTTANQNIQTEAGKVKTEDPGPPAQTVSSITVNPSGFTMNVGETQQFTATAFDANSNALTKQPTFSWSATGGSIDQNGSFSAGTEGGSIISASASGVTGNASGSIAAAVAPPVTPATQPADQTPAPASNPATTPTSAPSGQPPVE